MLMKKVYCIGLLVCDVPLRPVSKEIFSMNRCAIDPPVWGIGGDAANVAVALSKLGGRALFTGLVGNDMYGEFLKKRFVEAGVDIRGIITDPVMPTGVTHILIEPGGERHFLVQNVSINSTLDYSHVREEFIAESDYVFLGSSMSSLKKMDAGGTAELFKKAKSLGKITVTDCDSKIKMQGSYWLEYLDQVLRHCDILMPSLEEAQMLTGKNELPEIRDALSGYGISTLVVKIGDKGCYLTDFKDECIIPAFNEFKVLDTTGAGDSFVAGFLRGLMEGWDNKQAARFANCVAGFNVSKVGATAGVPDFETACRAAMDGSVNIAC